MRFDEIISEAAKPARLSFGDAKQIVADLDTGRGRIADVARRNPWLREMCVATAKRELGQRIIVYRAISVTDQLRPDAIASTTLDPKVAVSILMDAPGMIWHGNKTILPTRTLLRYEISPEDVVVWVPAILPAVRDVIGARGNHTVEDRYGERIRIADVLSKHASLDEKEIVADLSARTPTSLPLTPDSNGNAKLWAALMWLQDKLDEWLQDKPPAYKAALEAEFRGFFGPR